MALISAPYIIVARHGEFDPDTESLNLTGVWQALRLASQLSVRQDRLAIVSSKGPRAIQHARIVSEVLGVAMETSNAFTPADAKNPEECLPRAHEYMQQCSHDTSLCVITRGKVAKNLLNLVGITLGEDFAVKRLNYGEARLVDVNARTIEVF